jgi:hypothetical protein
VSALGVAIWWILRNGFENGLPPRRSCGTLVPGEIRMNELIFVVEEAPEGGYTARALGESIFTEADTIEEVRIRILDAVRCHFDEGSGPRIVRLHFVREEILAA